MRTAVAFAMLLCAGDALAQALPNINLLVVRYNSQKASAKPEAELKAQLDQVDRLIAEARKAGNNGELRRQIAKGLTLLRKEAWTPALDFEHSLVLRAERTVVDSTTPLTFRLEQIYRPAIDIGSNLTAKVSIRPRPTRGQPAAPRRELASFDGLSRDLRESPFPMEVSVASIEDGAFVIDTEVFEGSTLLGRAALNVVLNKGLDTRLRALESAAATVPAAIRADVLYPADFIRNVNRARIELGAFDVGREITIAEGLAAAAKAGKDPFKGRTGDFERHHVLAGADEVMPYRVYVPKNYSAAKPTPLVIALHGLGANEDSFFDSYDRLPPQLAEKHGFLMAAPLGYRVDGFYGSRVMGGNDIASQRRGEYSEKDVLEVLRLMKANYNVDDSRIYLIGHSMGAIGTWALAAKYPQIWAATAAFAGTGAPDLAAAMKAIPHFVVHGDADPTVNVSGSRRMVAAMQEAGATVSYVEVPGGGHSDVVVPNLPKAFEFIAGHRRR
ncbi:MAG TPA: alpha/beta fold hydrolase [Vicinamibacterales bacterium]|nr:alpha/beta fold hydrolase [Vicinamibacterales bacterium]